MKTRIQSALMLFLCIGFATISNAQKITDQTFQGLKLRNVGPAFTSGRIADIAIHPQNENVWYVAVGSGMMIRGYR